MSLVKRVDFRNDLEDARIARLSALIANVNSKDKKYDWEDFMPIKKGQDEPERELTPEETAEYFKSFAIESGGVVLDAEGNVIDGDPARLPAHQPQQPSEN